MKKNKRIKNVNPNLCHKNLIIPIILLFKIKYIYLLSCKIQNLITLVDYGHNQKILSQKKLKNYNKKTISIQNNYIIRNMKKLIINFYVKMINNLSFITQKIILKR